MDDPLLYQRCAYAFDLPPALIAQEPAADRDASRLLVVDRPVQPTAAAAAPPAAWHATFRDLPAWLTAGDLLVINDTTVLPARLYARRPSGARVEILLLALSGEAGTALLRANRPLRDGDVLHVEHDGAGDTGCATAGADAAGMPEATATLVVGPRLSEDGVREVRIPGGWLTPHQLADLGVPPLPPYIRRDPHDPRLRTLDRQRYQTVYAAPPAAADRPFSAAAPTAGLHFTPALLQRCAETCAGVVAVTLTVGLGTFRPVRADDVREHAMHAEPFRVSGEALAQLRAHREAGGRLVPVGTTSARVLETLARLGHLPARPDGTAEAVSQPPRLDAEVTATADGGLAGHTALFLHPPHVPCGFDGLITNFHLPESTLVMLIATLLGREPTLTLYAEAVRLRYRFFSYGDAMFIRPPRHGAVPAASAENSGIVG